MGGSTTTGPLVWVAPPVENSDFRQMAALDRAAGGVIGGSGGGAGGSVGSGGGWRHTLMSIFQQRGDTGAARFTPTTAATKCGVDSGDDHVPHQQPGSGGGGGGGGGGGHLSLLQPVEDTLRDRLISAACRCTCAARSGLSAAIDLEGLLLGENGLWSLVPYGNIMADRKLIDDADTAARRMWLVSRAATKIVRN